MAIDPALKAKLKNIIKDVANSKEVSSDFAEKLPAGTHQVILKDFNAKETKTDETVFLEANFVVEKSAVVALGETRGQSWYTGKPGHFGKFESDRARKFMIAVQQCVGDDRLVEETGDDLTEGLFRGVRLSVTVKQKFEKDGVTAMKGGKGQDLYDVIFTPIKGQTIETVEEGAAKIEQLELAQAAIAMGAASAPAPAAAASTPAPTPAAPPAATSGFAGLATAPIAPPPAPARGGFAGFGARK